MRSLKTRATSLLSAGVLLPLLAHGAGPVKLTSADLDLQHHKIVVASGSNEEDFLAALPDLAKPQSWSLRVKPNQLPISSVAVDVPNRAIDLNFKPGTFQVFDAGDI